MLTKSQKRRHQLNPTSCPFCQSEHFHPRGKDKPSDPVEIIRPFICQDCDGCWSETYMLISVQGDHKPNPVKLARVEAMKLARMKAKRKKP